MKMKEKKQKLEFLGWILFSCGSFIYFVDSILNQNFISALGSFTFLSGCAIFMVAEKTST